MNTGNPQLHPAQSGLKRLRSAVVHRLGATPLRALRRCARPVLESLERREVLSLTGVAPNAGFPYTAIVELQATFPDHQSFVSSGVMVDSFHVLTAGHVVYSYADGGFASQITATPELYGNSKPFGTASMTYERTYTTWVNYSKAHPGLTAPGDMDIGLITLNTNIGNSTGWMSYGYDNNNNDFSAGTIMNTAGYPAAGGYNGQYMEFSSGPLAGLSSDGSALQYYQSSITTYGGSSGSPVWRYTSSNNSRVVYGVVAGGGDASNSLNFATRITQGIFNDLQNWRATDTPPRTTYLSPLALNTTHVNALALTPSTVTNPAFSSTFHLNSEGVNPAPTAPVGVALPPVVAFGDVPKGPMWHKDRLAAFV